MAESCLERIGGLDSRAAHVTTVLDADNWLAYWQGRNEQPPRPPPPLSIKIAYRWRLAEIALAIEALANETPFPIAAVGGEGWGIGQCATARGLLTHAVHVVDGVVANYRVWAPTDVHFADASALAPLLAGRGFTSLNAARQALDQAILALDPCLPYTVELSHA